MMDGIRNETIRMLVQYQDRGMTPSDIRKEIVKTLPQWLFTIYQCVLRDCWTSGEIAHVLGRSQNAVATGLKELVEMGLLERDTTAQPYTYRAK